MPDNKESYYAPHIIGISGKEHVVFGTGGETIGGSIFIAPLEEFLEEGSLQNANAIVSDSLKGFILNSVSTDLNNDGQADIVCAGMNGGTNIYYTRYFNKARFIF